MFWLRCLLRNAECGCVSALGLITVGAMNMIVSDSSLFITSLPPNKGATAARLPVVPRIPVVFVPSLLRVRPARTTTSPGADQKLVSIRFANCSGELVAVADQDSSYFNAADQTSGFKTQATATAPVRHDIQVFGVLQAINKTKSAGCNDTEFSTQDLDLLELFGHVLGSIMSNINYAEKAIKNSIIRHDIEQAKEVKTHLFRAPDPLGNAAGCVIPAGSLSGDFYDFIVQDGRLAFCQGDVAGKGIVASLTMARSLALFRYLAGNGADARTIALAINDALLEGGSDQFLTFCCGWFNQASGAVSLINCGHNPVLHFAQAETSLLSYPADTVPLGIVSLTLDDFVVHQFYLTGGPLFLLTDGISEAVFDDVAIDDKRLFDLLGSLARFNVSDIVAKMRGLFASARLQSHDDATLLVIHVGGH